MSHAPASSILPAGPATPRAGKEAAPVFRDIWVIAFVATGFLLQLGLWFVGDTALRLPLRMGTYILSLAFLVLIRGKTKLHPGTQIMQYILLVLLIAIINPQGDHLIARVAQLCLYFSILAPLLWVGKLRMTHAGFQKLVLIMWTFYTASATMGVLQVEYPGKYDGALSSNFDEQNITPHVFMLADGTKFIRPKGLTDVPGGASGGGVSAIILGLGLLLTTRNILLRVLSIGGMVSGLFCIFICQMRTNLIVAAIAALALLIVLLNRRSHARAGILIAIAGGVIFAGGTAAFAIGGQSTIDRFLTLVADNPSTVFYNNRGAFLDNLVHRDVFAYPLGAGLGRWGMMNHYFGGSVDPLWAEMMWQSLLFDGGVPLIALYIALIVCMLWTALKIALHQRDDDVGCWAGVVFGYTLAAAAATFVYPIFSNQQGMEVFLLNAALFGLCVTTDAAQPPRRTTRTRVLVRVRNPVTPPELSETTS